jgi:riboflavin kinase, archaea type
VLRSGSKLSSSLKAPVLPTLVFYGTVFSGRGEGRKFVSLPWVTPQIKEKAGFKPYLGTLNLRLTCEAAKLKQQLLKAYLLPIEPAEGYCPGFLIKAKIGSLAVAIVVPEVPNYPVDVLEVVAPFSLREKEKLIDGSGVVVEVIV